MERQHRPRAREHRAHGGEPEQTRRDIAAEMQVHDIELELPEDAEESGHPTRIVYVLVSALRSAGDVDDGAGNPALPEEPPDRHEIRLYSPVGRRIRPQLEHAHQPPGASTRCQSATSGTPPRRADSMSLRQTIVARAPSCTDTGL